MKIVILGKSGQVAQSLARHANAHDMVFLGRPEMDFAAPDAAAAYFEDYLAGAGAVDVVINAAAYTAVDQAESEEELATAINAETPGAIAKICAAYGLPFLHISTDYVFAGDKDGAYVEDDAVAPEGAYGRSKLAGEQAVMAAHAGALVLRTAWVYSPFGKNFVKTMLRLAETRDELGVVGDQIGSPTYAPDIADGLIALARQLVASNLGGGAHERAGVYHFAGTGCVSWHGFAEEIFRLLEEQGGNKPRVNEITTADFPTPAKRPANSKLDCSKLLQNYELQLPHWTDALARCIADLKDTNN